MVGVIMVLGPLITSGASIGDQINLEADAQSLLEDAPFLGRFVEGGRGRWEDGRLF